MVPLCTNSFSCHRAQNKMKNLRKTTLPITAAPSQEIYFFTLGKFLTWRNMNRASNGCEWELKYFSRTYCIYLDRHLSTCKSGCISSKIRYQAPLTSHHSNILNLYFAQLCTDSKSFFSLGSICLSSFLTHFLLIPFFPYRPFNILSHCSASLLYSLSCYFVFSLFL